MPDPGLREEEEEEEEEEEVVVVEEDEEEREEDVTHENGDLVGLRMGEKGEGKVQCVECVRWKMYWVVWEWTRGREEERGREGEESAGQPGQ
ncbi:hypothetical protein E2C01_083537 [Portunus trituberculatus]|uniref:Uncharacterized protein n=1 Tax=Portunus trituberculatus TaxID=210409 RepID=A0A5B7ISR1_PORTR|nr:hypothetical protein [Portunus trituberculatus]